jgi:hypothetical protein
MKRQNLILGPAVLLVFSFLVGPLPARAQKDGGDQFLDGIGETALVARYLLNGTTADRSRNGHQATLHGTGATFVEDSQFGKVLSLPGTGGAYVQIPGEALAGVDTLSITGWVFLRSTNAWQRFFDFGPNTISNLFGTPIGEEPANGYRVRLTTNGWTEEQGPTTPQAPTHQWIHLAVALDAARHTP